MSWHCIAALKTQKEADLGADIVYICQILCVDSDEGHDKDGGTGVCPAQEAIVEVLILLIGSLEYIFLISDQHIPEYGRKAVVECGEDGKDTCKTILYTV